LQSGYPNEPLGLKSFPKLDYQRAPSVAPSVRILITLTVVVVVPPVHVVVVRNNQDHTAIAFCNGSGLLELLLCVCDTSSFVGLRCSALS
jgi:hypothetical protein